MYQTSGLASFQVFSCVHLPSLYRSTQITDIFYCIQFYVGSRDPSSGLHVCWKRSCLLITSPNRFFPPFSFVRQGLMYPWPCTPDPPASTSSVLELQLSIIISRYSVKFFHKFGIYIPFGGRRVNLVLFRIILQGLERLAQWLRALVILAEGLSSITCTYMIDHNYL